jgi:hypothetical protein
MPVDGEASEITPSAQFQLGQAISTLVPKKSLVTTEKAPA